MVFSIITPSLGQLDWLRTCVASVADQSGAEPSDRSDDRPPPAVEHIIQDGGTAGIEEFARGIGAEFYRNGERVFGPRPPSEGARSYRLAIYSEPDAGMYDAINRGIARMSGDLWAWLNCDEQYLPGAIAYVAGWFAANRDKDILCGDVLLLDGAQRALSYRRTVTPGRLLARLSHLPNPSCATFYRRGVLGNGGIFDTTWRSIGDAEWMARLLALGCRAGSCRRLLGAYAFTGVNVSASETAIGEAARWRGMPDAPPGWLRIPVIVHHRLRKLLAGAYRKRTVSYALYEKGSAGRVMRTAERLGWAWPEPNAKRSPSPAK